MSLNSDQGINNIRTINNISNEQLVELCINKDRNAWEVFFQRFLPVIISTIKNKLIRTGNYKLANDEDVVWDINEITVTKLYKSGTLRKCKDTTGIHFWLIRMAENDTFDWLRKQRQTKQLPKRQIDQSMVTLTDNINVLHPTDIPNYFSGSHDQQPDNLIDDIIDNINSITNVKNRWVLRLSILRYLPLNDHELTCLATIINRSLNDIKDMIADMEIDLTKKEEIKEASAARAATLWYEIERLQAMLSEARRDDTGNSQEKINSYESKIKNKEKIRSKHLKQCNQICRPSYKQIAELLRFNDKEELQVSVMLKRGRSSIDVSIMNLYRLT